MAAFEGFSDTSNLRMRTPDLQVKALEFNPDKYKVMPEIMYRSYHQQRFAPVQQPAQAPLRRRYADEEFSAPRRQLAALGQSAPPPMPGSDLIPYYNKMEQGRPGVVGGLRSAMPYEPGAWFAGYLPRGYTPPQPRESSFVGGGGGGGGSTGPSVIPRPTQASANPNTSTGAGSYVSGNPYATGAGIVGGNYQISPFGASHAIADPIDYYGGD